MSDDRPGAIAVTGCSCLRLPKVRSALLLGHRHTDSCTCFFRRPGLPAVIMRRSYKVAPLFPDRLVASENRHRGIRHTDRTANSIFSLVPQKGEPGTGDLRAGPRIGPT